MGIRQTLFLLLLTPAISWASVEQPKTLAQIKKMMKAIQPEKRKLQNKNETTTAEPLRPLSSERVEATPLPLRRYTYVDDRPQFDLPVTYNLSVRKWVQYFQGPGRKWFKTWLERSARYIPNMAEMLAKKGLPQDLAYVAMIESGFSSKAVSSAQAVGYWQFIKSTANRYGLRTTWWLDERRDFAKSTLAAANYLGDLYRLFNSWYLAAAAFNMGEGRTQRLVDKYKTTNFWVLAKKPEFPAETREYIPKLIAAMLIAKAPKLYGFDDLKPLESYEYEYFHVPGGTDLHTLANQIGIDRKVLLKLNPELLQGYVPESVNNHRIRIPTGYLTKVSHYIRERLTTTTTTRN